MLLGLAIAVLLALAFQLNALRLRGSDSFYMTADGAISLKAWIVVEIVPVADRILHRPARAFLAVGRLAAGRRANHHGRYPEKRRAANAIRMRILDELYAALRRRSAQSTGPPAWQVPRPWPGAVIA
jgi:hypothetical protein